MRIKSIIIVSVVFILLSVGIYSLYELWQSEKSKRQAAERNITALVSDIETYRTDNGELVTKIQGLELNSNNLEQVQSRLYNEISGLKLKLKNALSVTEVETEDKFTNSDTIYLTVKNDSTKTFEYSDSWRYISAEITNNTINPHKLITRMSDTLYCVPVIIYKGWWFWKKPKSIEAHFKNKNPNVSIKGANFIYLNNK
ncbi:MAG: DUF6549 family protein [Muribaculaceae bacterium]